MPEPDDVERAILALDLPGPGAEDCARARLRVMAEMSDAELAEILEPLERVRRHKGLT